MENSLGKILKSARNRKNLTQKSLAMKIGTKESTVRMWELDKNKPPVEALEKVFDVLEMNSDEKRKVMEEAGYWAKSFFELINQTSPYDNITKKNGMATFGPAHNYPKHDIHFHLNDQSADKYYKTVKLSDIDKEEIKKIIKNYLVGRLISEGEADQEQIKILLDDDFFLSNRINSDLEKE